MPERVCTHACVSPAFTPGPRIFMRITHAASCISAPTGACAAHFKRKIFSRLLINGRASRHPVCACARPRGPLATLKRCKNLPLNAASVHPHSARPRRCTRAVCTHARSLAPQQAIIIMRALRDTATLIGNTSGRGAVAHLEGFTIAISPSS